MTTQQRSGCPINAAVETFGDQWTLLVLRDVMFGDRRHFRSLQAGSEERIASNILADRLQRLVRDGLLTRDGAGRGQKATYSLTEAAIQLVPVLAQLGAWGLRHRPIDPELGERAEQLEAGGPNLWGAYMGRTPSHPPHLLPIGHPRLTLAVFPLVLSRNTDRVTRRVRGHRVDPPRTGAGCRSDRI